MPLSFTAVDFETATVDRASACAVGIATVVDGAVTGVQRLGIYPPTGLEFTNTAIHGISAADVQDAPGWDAAVAELLRLAAGTPLIAFRAFDRGVWNAAHRVSGSDAPDVEFLDALGLTRQLLPLDAYRLPRVAEHLGVPAPGERATARGGDAQTCARVVLALAERVGADSVTELWAAADEAARPRRTAQHGPVSPIPAPPAPDPTAAPGHPLYGESVCFSGVLASHSRSAAQAACAALGASVTAALTDATTLLVTGSAPGPDAGTLAGARDRIAAGQRLDIIEEADFRELLAAPSRPVAAVPAGGARARRGRAVVAEPR